MGCNHSSQGNSTSSGATANRRPHTKRNQSVYGAEALAFAADGKDEVPKKSEMKPESTIHANMGIAKVRYAYVSKRGLYPDGKLAHAKQSSIVVLCYCVLFVFCCCRHKMLCSLFFSTCRVYITLLLVVIVIRSMLIRIYWMR